MKPFTYTPPDATVSIGFAFANGKAKAAHDNRQTSLRDDDQEPYGVTDEQYAHAALDRVGRSYYAQALEEAGEAKWDFVLEVAATKDNPVVAEKLAALEAAVAAARRV